MNININVPYFLLPGQLLKCFWSYDLFMDAKIATKGCVGSPALFQVASIAS